MKAYWWPHANFGDQLTPLLLRHFLGVQVDWAPADEAEWIAVGSIAAHVPRGWAGTVWGIGKHRQREWDVDLSHATILALRGKLTAEALGVDTCALGDPGLLVSLLPGIKRTSEHRLGIVPHWQDRWLAWRHRGYRIEVKADPMAVIRQIAACDRIVSSSLHGIIVADAFGIPRRWERAPQATPYKFRDHMTVVGDFEYGKWYKADRRKVRAAQQALLASLP
jgi:hypothetical protein